MRFRKKLPLLICIIVAILCLNSCGAITLYKSIEGNILTRTNSSHVLLEACYRRSVPGAYYRDLRGDVCADVVDTDDYGRTLLYNETSNEKGAYVICQKYGNSTVYFYEDINYIIVQNNCDDLDALLDEFKKTNDWNCEMNEAMFSKRQVRLSPYAPLLIDTSFDLSKDKLYSKLEDAYGISEKDVKYLDYCDWDEQNHKMYILFLENGEKYFCIVDTDYSINIKKIEEGVPYSEIIKPLKAESGWHYGC